ncbi:RNA polymerase sigma factor SigJ [Pleionea sp. CnH1-48]|uniref:RNA polymerase sigma factor SigJ n=1 Tax=Pleionea sp. CnH1-48 TaxID=2954494 RepID=UPI0020972B77|nr:RNA polymerase sigma factor SigJ [Pleionea sp. CnH1-48]MCO7226675.1 RNA polymerase sigma factor SigJ [Pleionea sp. CnH1-48]
MHTQTDLIHIFEAMRPTLMGLAYRILGSVSDAEDAVQDTYLKLIKSDTQGINNPKAWLSTVCTRRCLDMLRSANKTRVNYVGAWLPEPIQQVQDDDHSHELAASLTTDFLLLLERLTPKERAAFLLHELLEQSYSDIAKTLTVSEVACRKLVSRAKTHIGREHVRQQLSTQQQETLLSSFEQALRTGDTTHFAKLLTEDVTLTADGGGVVPALLESLEGKEKVLRFIGKKLQRYWLNYSWNLADFNQSRAVVVKDGDQIIAIMTLAHNAKNQISQIFIQRNPNKMKHLLNAKE